MKSLCCSLLVSILMLSPVQAEFIEIDNAHLKTLLEQNVPLVDIRTDPEWTETGIVAGSKLLTFFDANGQYDAQAWLAQLAPIAAKDAPVILICRTGRRTGLVGHFLAEKIGYQKVYNVTGGIREWIDRGNPTVAP